MSSNSTFSIMRFCGMGFYSCVSGVGTLINKQCFNAIVTEKFNAKVMEKNMQQPTLGLLGLHT